MGDTTVFRVRLDTDEHDLGCLSSDERAKAATFRRPAGARSWATTRAVLRSVLAVRIDVPADQIVFERAERDRLILGEGMPGAVSFNVARTQGLALVAVSTVSAIGVDVEAIAPVTDLLAVARRVLRPEVCAALADAPAGERDARFFRAWVRHEARLKCRGTGLVEPSEDDGRVDDLTIVDVPVDARHAAALAIVGRDSAYELVDHVARAPRARVA
jgi:4'-phosphopantetheinyl transferase